MAGTSRDRVTIDLRGIGPSVRAAASARRLRVALPMRGTRSPRRRTGRATPSVQALPIERAAWRHEVTLRLDRG